MILLDSIETPRDLRALPRESLPQLCAELKEYLVDTVSKSGGHLASSLGVLELTVGLHYVFDTPHDLIVWDVGHQCYIHKILTGRKNRLSSIRSMGGLCGFPKRSESVYDTFDTGHAGTAISAALGMAIAHRGTNRKVIAVIGDGGLTSGMAYEALNHAGDLQENLLIIVNDNQMSISPNVGALNQSMYTLYRKVRMQGKNLTRGYPLLHETARKIDQATSSLTQPQNLFTSLGMHYYGPDDGHDLNMLIDTLTSLKIKTGTRVYNILTKKGYGYKLAEQDPVVYHGVSPFNKNQGISPTKNTSKSYSQIFGDWLIEQAKQDTNFSVITPAMIEGSGLRKFSERYPRMLHDVGIAEQHAITLAAGMACTDNGVKPIVAVYATFLQRGYDQCLHDVLLQDLDVLFAIDRAGLVGGDGATHHGIFDLGFLLPLPNTVIMTPSDEEECWRCLNTGYFHKGPAFVRYPRGSGSGAQLTYDKDPYPLGSSKIIRNGKDIAILVFGPLLPSCQQCADTLNATLVDMRFVRPLDTSRLHDIASSHSHLITIEDHVSDHGAGSQVSMWLHSSGYKNPLLCIGLPREIIEHGTQMELYQSLALHPEGILMRVQKWLENIALYTT